MTAPDWTALRQALGPVPEMSAQVAAGSARASARLDQAHAAWRSELARLGADIDDPVVAHAVLAGIDVFVRVLATATSSGAICGASAVAISAAHKGVIATLRDHIPQEGTHG